MIDIQVAPTVAGVLSALNISIFLGIVVIALVLFSFAKSFRGILLGFLSLLIAGVFAFSLYGQFSDASHPDKYLKENAERVQLWASETYGLNLSSSESSRLASGTEAYTSSSKSQRFGESAKTYSLNLKGGAIVSSIILVHTGGQKVSKGWLLAYNSDSAKDTLTTLPTKASLK